VSAKIDPFCSSKGFFVLKKGFSPPKMVAEKICQKSTDDFARYPFNWRLLQAEEDRLCNDLIQKGAWPPWAERFSA
jgi:hypothetical protein